MRMAGILFYHFSSCQSCLTLPFFGNKLNSSDPLSELDVFVCFMSVAISCFLCPVMSHSVNLKYLSILKDPAAAKGYDFSQLVYAHCLKRLVWVQLIW